MLTPSHLRNASAAWFLAAKKRPRECPTKSMIMALREKVIVKVKSETGEQEISVNENGNVYEEVARGLDEHPSNLKLIFGEEEIDRESSFLENGIGEDASIHAHHLTNDADLEWFLKRAIIRLSSAAEDVAEKLATQLRLEHSVSSLDDLIDLVGNPTLRRILQLAMNAENISDDKHANTSYIGEIVSALWVQNENRNKNALEDFLEEAIQHLPDTDDYLAETITHQLLDGDLLRGIRPVGSVQDLLDIVAKDDGDRRFPYFQIHYCIRHALRARHIPDEDHQYENVIVTALIEKHKKEKKAKEMEELFGVDSPTLNSTQR